MRRLVKPEEIKSKQEHAAVADDDMTKRTQHWFESLVGVNEANRGYSTVRYTIRRTTKLGIFVSFY